MPLEQYEEIRGRIKSDVDSQIPIYGDLTEEFIERIRKDKFNKTTFLLSKMEDGKFGLIKFDYRDIAAKRIYTQVSLDEISIDILMEVIREAMQSHRDFDSFQSNNFFNRKANRRIIRFNS